MGRNRPAHEWRQARRARNVVLGLVLSAAMASAAALPALVSSRMTDREVAALLDAWAGPAVTWHGEPQISVFPTLEITLRDVKVLDRAAPGTIRASMPTVEISFKTLPLLFGRIEPDTVSLVGPDIRLPAEPPAMASSGRQSPFGTLLLADGDSAPDVIVLSDGVIRYTLPHTGGARTLRTADLRLAWDQDTRAAALTGRLIADGREFVVDAELHHPWQLFSAAGARGRVRLDTAPAGADAPFDVAGTFRLYAAEDRGRHRPETQQSAPIDTLEISEASFTLAGAAGRGTVAMTSTGARPAIAGTLEFDQLDLEPHVRSWLPETFAELLALPVDADWLRLARIDLTATADAVDFGSARVTDAAARLAMQRGRLELSLTRAEFAGGEIEASVALSDAGSRVRARVAGEVREISLGEVTAQLQRPRSTTLIGTDEPPRGDVAASFELHATGARVGELIRSIAGRAVAEVHDGSIDGADAVSTLERVVDGGAGIAEGQAPFIPIAGRTHFTEWSAHVAAEHGVARLKRMRLVGDRFEILLAGEIDLADGELFANGSARLFGDEDGSGTKLLVELPFGIGGTLLEPMGAPGIPRRPAADSRTAQHRPLPAPQKSAHGDPDVG